MRSLRWLLLVAMAIIAAAVFGIYRAQRIAAGANARPLPSVLPLGEIGNAVDFEWGQSADGKPKLKVTAKDSTQLDNNKTQLRGVELQIYQKDGQHYDRVRSPYAEMSAADHKLYAPGEAEITLDVPVSGEPTHALTSIKAAGINFDTESGEAVSDKPVAFTFEGGDGTSTGASYNPQTFELHPNQNVSVNMRGKDPKGKPMLVQAGELTYNEKDGLVKLGPWSRMTKGQTVINAGNSVVKLRAPNKKIDTIDAQGVKGTDKRPGKELEYSADNAHVQYNEDGRMEKLNGAGNANLVSHGNGSNTTMSGNTVDLYFNTQKSESELASAFARGNAAIESKPAPDPKGATPDTKIVRAEALDLHMKPGGKDVDRINTQSPGTLEFLPNQIARHRRVLKAAQMDIGYGAKNEIQSFHAVKASTETYPSEDDRKKKKPNLAIAYTSSNVMDAAFDAKGELKLMKQTGDFKYAEGPRKAQADDATLENEHNVMDLDKHARIADDAGSTAADHIALQQATGDFDATGHVSTTRLPDEKKTSSDMLDKDQPTQGLADHVVSANRNRLIHYIGNAVLWQESNRIQGDRIDVDREKKALTADGQVVSQFQDKAKDEAPKKNDKAAKTAPLGPAPVFTIVRAPHMVYTDQNRLAVYTGGVTFSRGPLTVKCTTLKAFLNDNNSDADSRINHAFADGSVEIAQSTPLRKRVGTSDHAEYYTDEGKVILTGGQPQLNDTLRGNTTGEVLTYFTDDDRMINTGTPQKQVRSHLRKKDAVMQTLETVEISKSYRGRRVVDDVSVNVSQGEIVGLLGPNGAGKTTSFYMVVGLISPDSGKVLLDGTDLTNMPMFRRARNGISYLPQEASVFRKLTVEENLMAILQTRRMSGRERREKMNQLIGQMGLDTVRRSKGYVLSGGERRRVEIARSLAIDPSFLLLDEPFSGIDPIQVIELQRIILDLKRAGLGILVTDHNVRETLSVTDRAYIINAGKIFRSGNPNKLAQDPEVKRVYLGETFRFNVEPPAA